MIKEETKYRAYKALELKLGSFLPKIHLRWFKGYLNALKPLFQKFIRSLIV